MYVAAPRTTSTPRHGARAARARQEDATTSGECSEAADRARQTLALLPVLRRWVTARVQWAGADVVLSLRQYAALTGIRHGASSPGELARLWQVTPAVITGIVDRLEKRDLVRREPDPDDRRRLQLVLTDTGLAASADIERAMTGDLATRLATASPRELAELGRALDLLQRTFAALDEQTPRPAAPRADEDHPSWDADSDDEEDQTIAGQPGRRQSSPAGAER